MRLFAFTCGWISADLGLFLRGASGRIRVPVPVYLVDHPRGLLLFDTGLHPAVAASPEARLGSRITSRFDVRLAEDAHVVARLTAAGFDPGRVERVVGSHLHFDHAGGYECLPGARLLLQRAEWEAGRIPEFAERLGFQSQDFDHGHDRELLDGEHDVFGDGSVVCVPTPGHTPGHQSLRVRLAAREVLLTADACYLRRSLDEALLPPLVHDSEAALNSLERIARFERMGARVVFGHDPELWDQIDPEGFGSTELRT